MSLVLISAINITIIKNCIIELLKFELGYLCE